MFYLACKKLNQLHAVGGCVIGLIMIKKLPSKEYLNECFSLTKNGELFWKERPLIHFKNNVSCNRFNKSWAGTKAGCDMGNGYFAVSIDSERFKLHRVIYQMVIGDVNKITHIDHANGNSKDNKPENLRASNASLNAVNFKGFRSDSKSKARGVTWNSQNKKWEAYAYKDGVRYQCGLFSEKEKAAESSYLKRVELFGEVWTSQNEH